MTDSDSSDPNQTSAQPSTTAATPGSLLRAAREAAGLSVGDVSTRLRMGVRQIDALERGDYAALPTGTFLRGMVRNYAKAVNANADTAIRLLEDTHSNAAVSLKDAKIVVPTHNIKLNRGPSEPAPSKTKWAVGAIVFALLAGAFWYWWQYIRPNLDSGGRAPQAAEKAVVVEPPKAVPAAIVPTTSAPVTPALAPLATAPTQTQPLPPGQSAAKQSETTQFNATQSNATQFNAAQTTANTAATVALPPTLAESSSSSPVAESITLKAAPTAPTRPEGSAVLGFTFAGDSWIEVVDGRGRAIISRKFQAGDAEEVVGRAPFSIVVGNAPKVRMAYNGKEFDLQPHTKTSVARLTLK